MDDSTSSRDRSIFHGGDLAWAERRFGRPAAGWVDLSTGINPWPYPLPTLPAEAWARLPDAAALGALEAAAAGCYGAPSPEHIAAAPGTQALIRLLPRLRPPGRVAVVGPTYAEHAAGWRDAGHRVVDAADPLDAEAAAADPVAAATGTDIVVVTNPNNPDGRTHAPEALLAAAEALAARGRLLLVDEAFADVAPEVSLAPHCGRPGLVVLRSFGKFFGLAGLRLGFALAEPALAATIRAALGPWPVAGPAIAVARTALADRAWIAGTRARLAEAAAELRATLAAAGLAIVGGTD
ncbi:MAG: threonine-phosphate decarboxylase, partial [Inquilinus sp.]|nr:threonine-phosphate decarboxylase [Inquilinus sp.]